MGRSVDLDTVAPDDREVKTPKIEVKKMLEKVSDSIQTQSTIRQKAYEILGHTSSPLSSFLVKPHVFSFQERGVDEEIILAMRPHWITNVAWILTALLMLAGPTFLKYVPLFSGVAFKYQMVGIMFWYMVTFAFILEKFLSWYFNVFIITDERVIDIDFNNLLNKKFSEAKISMIQDVTSHVSGVAQTLFNYGTVLIQTAAEINQIEFDKIPNPEKVIKVLQLMREEEEQEALEGRIK